MDIVKIIAIGLIAAGALGLTYGGFTYTQTTHEAGLVNITQRESRLSPKREPRFSRNRDRYIKN